MTRTALRKQRGPLEVCLNCAGLLRPLQASPLLPLLATVAIPELGGGSPTLLCWRNLPPMDERRPSLQQSEPLHGEESAQAPCVPAGER